MEIAENAVIESPHNKNTFSVTCKPKATEMKQYSTFIILVFLIGLCSFNCSEQDYILTVQKGKVLKEDKTTYWIIPTTLKNNSNDTLKYFSMSCSWEEFYSVDNKKLEIEPKSCDKNIPKILTLAPGKESTVEIKLIINKTIDEPKIKFKIGFNLMKVDNGKTIFDYDYKEEQKKKNIIWSNEILM
ncbi:hypothetical protein [Empedobacter brevis]|uniref:hypothetical protein n=1 Tax=Empedobacter brevis TaxID=247 RepID=UPI002FE26636